jgi:hypothetical protein
MIADDFSFILAYTLIEFLFIVENDSKPIRLFAFPRWPLPRRSIGNSWKKKVSNNQGA